MGIEPHPCGSCDPQERRAAGRAATANAAEQRKTMTVLRRRSRLPGQPRQLDAGPLEPLIGSFALHLAAEGKAARTVQGYTSAVRWFAAGYLAGERRQDQLGAGGRPGYPAVDDASCWAGTAARTPASSSGRCGSSSSGGPQKKTSPTRWPGSGRRRSP